MANYIISWHVRSCLLSFTGCEASHLVLDCRGLRILRICSQYTISIQSRTQLNACAAPLVSDFTILQAQGIHGPACACADAENNAIRAETQKQEQHISELSDALADLHDIAKVCNITSCSRWMLVLKSCLPHAYMCACM